MSSPRTSPPYKDRLGFVHPVPSNSCLPQSGAATRVPATTTSDLRTVGGVFGARVSLEKVLPEFFEIVVSKAPSSSGDYAVFHGIEEETAARPVLVLGTCLNDQVEVVYIVKAKHAKPLEMLSLSVINGPLRSSSGSAVSIIPGWDGEQYILLVPFKIKRKELEIWTCDDGSPQYQTDESGLSLTQQQCECAVRTLHELVTRHSFIDITSYNGGHNGTGSGNSGATRGKYTENKENYTANKANRPNNHSFKDPNGAGHDTGATRSNIANHSCHPNPTYDKFAHRTNHNAGAAARSNVNNNNVKRPDLRAGHPGAIYEVCKILPMNNPF